MSWAELLKKSAEYARKSLEELAAALRPPHHKAPSFEPAYSKYRNKGFHPPSQRRAYCTTNHKRFFGHNFPGWIGHASADKVTEQQLELMQGIQEWHNQWYSHWHSHGNSHWYRNWQNGSNSSKNGFHCGFMDWHARWHAKWHAKIFSMWEAKLQRYWQKKFCYTLERALWSKGKNNWISLWHTNWHHNWETIIHYDLRHNLNDIREAKHLHRKHHTQGTHAHANNSNQNTWWTWSRDYHNRYHEWRQQWLNEWQGRELNWHHNTHDQWASHCKRNRHWRSDFPHHHHHWRHRRHRHRYSQSHPCFYPFWILLWFKMAVKCTNAVLVRSKCHTTSRTVTLNLSQKIPAMLPSYYYQHSGKTDKPLSLAQTSRTPLCQTEAPLSYRELLSRFYQRSQESRVNNIPLIELGRSSLLTTYASATEYDDSMAASIFTFCFDANIQAIEAEQMIEPIVEELPAEISASGSSFAAVDFSILPNLSLTGITGLNDQTVEQIRDAILGHISSLQSVLQDINRIAELGELPVSLEQNGSVLRIHFPNSDVDRVTVLADDKGVESGDIVEVSSTRSSSSGSALSVASSSVSSLSVSAESFVNVDANQSESESSLGSSWSEEVVPTPLAESLDGLWSTLHAQAPGLTDEPSSASESTFPLSLATQL